MPRHGNHLTPTPKAVRGRTRVGALSQTRIRMSHPPILLAVSAGPLFLLTAVGAAGLWLVVLGRRGKRLDHHPVCRSCRFDLRASVAPDADATDFTTCPECGSRGRPAVGNRRRRPAWVVAGVLIFALTLAATVMVSVAAFSPSVKFFTLLRMETRPWFAGDLAGDAALDELARRWQAGDLSTGQQDTLAADAVALGPARLPGQDRERASRWDAIAALAIRNGRGTHDERVALVRSWLTYTLAVRSQVGQGDDIRIGVAERTAGMDGLFGFALRQTPAYLTLNGKTSELFRDDRATYYAPRGAHHVKTRSKTFAANGPSLADLPLGKHSMEATFDVTLIDDTSNAKFLTWSERPTGTLNVVENPTPIGRIDDAELAERVLNRRVGTRRNHPSQRAQPQGRRLFFEVTAPMAYWIYAEHGNQRWRLGSVISDGKGGGLGTSVPYREPEPALPAGATVRLVFEPSFALARETFDLTEIIDRSFAIENVPVVDGPQTP